MRYTAVTTSGPVDIGEWPDQATAEATAIEQYGADLQAVILQQHDTVTVTADPPTDGMLLVGLVAMFLLANLSKPRSKKR